MVCTRDRASQLARTLETYGLIRFSQAWELIVVINASTDATPEIVDRFRSASLLKVIVVNQPVPGLCAARNLGWRSSHGEIVAFVDDDCYPAADFLSQLQACFDKPNLGFAGGKMLLFDDADLSFLSIQTKENRIDLPPRSVINAGLIHGGNMAFRRAVLKEIEGFDEWLGAGTPVKSGGDVDALSRASIAGYAGAYDPRVVVHHHHGRKTAEEGASVMAGYDVGRGAFLTKCLLDHRRRSLYALPVIRRIAGHLVKRRFGILRSELQGSFIYLQCIFREKRARKLTNV